MKGHTMRNRSRSEIQLLIATDLMRLFIERQISHYLNSQEEQHQ